MSGELIKQESVAAVRVEESEFTVDDLVRQVEKIREAMRRVMRAGVHYGTIEGMEKPSLWKPGAEVLCMLFRLAPEMTIVRAVETSDEITFVIRCDLTQMSTGVRYGSGIGSCSSREKKYGTRQAQRTCPYCKRASIFVSKKEPGFYCYGKVGGCGRNFQPNDQRITNQPVGTIPNPDIWEQHNTLLKMAQKRALVAAVLACTAASDSFTQDLEDKTGEPEPEGPPAPVRGPHPEGQTVGKPEAQPTVTATDTGPGPTMKQLRFYYRMLEQLNVTETEALGRVGEIVGHKVEAPEDLTGPEMSRVLDHMQKAVEANTGGAE